MKSLGEYLKDAEARRVAIGHFNISNLEQLHAITSVARRLKLPVVIGVSEGERKFIGLPETVALINVFREEGGLAVFLNADHTRSLEKIEEAARAGFDAAIIDAAKLPLAENIKITREAVKIAKAVNPAILIEGELGYIGVSSEVRDALPEGAAIEDKDMTTVAEAVRYVKETGVDLLAPAVGNIHGMFANAPEPRLNAERIGEIKKAVNVPLVLHGASGNTDADLKAAIAAGVSLIHISTEIRAAWRHGLEESLKEKPGEVAPYKLEAKSIKEMEEVIENKLRIFNRL